MAGATTAIIGLWIPEILGVGYDTVNFALAVELGLLALTLIVLATPIAALVAGALGLPIGVIGLTLFIDTTAGSLLWQLSQSVGSSRTDPAFFALLGMSAMMGATLNAPACRTDGDHGADTKLRDYLGCDALHYDCDDHRRSWL